MENLPLYIYFVFGLTTVAGILIFYKATSYSKSFLIVVSMWILFQTALSLSGFYKTSNTIPPRFLLLILPPVLLIIICFTTAKGKALIGRLDISTLTFFSIIRIPVEIVLFWLYTHKGIPQLMTFEGRNFDILLGLSAPIIYYFGFINRKLSQHIILSWNIICLILLLNIVINALLSIPGITQQFAFDQPNIAIGYFPFVLLPSCLVPLVLFSHLASIRQILLSKKINLTNMTNNKMEVGNIGTLVE